jgi:hypothetical protein
MRVNAVFQKPGRMDVDAGRYELLLGEVAAR